MLPSKTQSSASFPINESLKIMNNETVTYTLENKNATGNYETTCIGLMCTGTAPLTSVLN